MASLHFLLLIMIPCVIAYKLDSLSKESLSNSLVKQHKILNSPKNEYVRHIHSMMDAYNEDLNGKILIETNALINTKYQTLKRNGDFINSLLGFPKGLSDAGR